MGCRGCLALGGFGSDGNQFHGSCYTLGDPGHGCPRGVWGLVVGAVSHYSPPSFRCLSFWGVGQRASLLRRLPAPPAPPPPPLSPTTHYAPWLTFNPPLCPHVPCCASSCRACGCCWVLVPLPSLDGPAEVCGCGRGCGSSGPACWALPGSEATPVAPCAPRAFYYGPAQCHHSCRVPCQSQCAYLRACWACRCCPPPPPPRFLRVRACVVPCAYVGVCMW
jgi:hypothetical protein